MLKSTMVLFEFISNILKSTSQVAHFMLGKIFSASCRYLLPLKYNILPRKCLVVIWSYSDHVTTAGFSLKMTYFVFKIQRLKFIA